MQIKFFDNPRDINELKRQYWQLAKKYHPDINPAGADQMKIINNEYEYLFKYIQQNATNKQQAEYKKQGHSINDQYREVINAIIHIPDIIIELCGSWIWVSGQTKKYKEQLKATGFYWAPKKLQWYWRPEQYKAPKWRGKKTMTMDYIRAKYGSITIENEPFTQLEPAI